MKTPTILSYLISLLVPLALVGTVLRILLSPIYINIEYRMPYFPVDDYGMTQQELADRANISRSAV